MKTVIMGSGGIGGYFGGILAQCGNDVTFVARGKHLRSIQRDGLNIRSNHGNLTIKAKATDRVDEISTPDLILFTVKTYDTPSASEELAPIMGRGTTVLTLQNGVTSQEAIEDVLGSGRVLPGLVYIESTVSSPGVISQLGGPRRIVFGEPGGKSSRRVRLIESLLRESGILCEVSNDIVKELWNKFLFICALAGVTSTARLTLGEILDSEVSRWAFEEAIRETYSVGLAHKVNLTEGTVEAAISVANSMNPKMKSSMQRDLEAGRRLEIDALNGVVTNLGRRYGIRVPVNQCIYSFIKPHDIIAEKMLTA